MHIGLLYLNSATLYWSYYINQFKIVEWKIERTTCTIKISIPISYLPLDKWHFNWLTMRQKQCCDYQLYLHSSLHLVVYILWITNISIIWTVLNWIIDFYSIARWENALKLSREVYLDYTVDWRALYTFPLSLKWNHRWIFIDTNVTLIPYIVQVKLFRPTLTQVALLD